jgi:hypothetical protein
MIGAVAGLTFDAERHEYAFEGRPVPSPTRILREVGIIQGNRSAAEAAMERGKDVHRLCEHADRGTLDWDLVEPDHGPYLKAWIKATVDLGVTWEAIEQPVYQATYGYAGTPDRVGVTHLGRAVYDIKTGVPQRWHALQLAAYQLALPFADGPYRRFGVYLSADGKYRIKEYADRSDDAVFLAALSLYHWKVRTT